MSHTFRSISDSKLIIFYKWLRSRNVFYVEDFPIRLDALEDLVSVLDVESYCPVLRSIEITRWSIINEHSSVNSHVNLSIFLSHCHNLQEVAVWMSDLDSDVVVSVLVEQLRENSLVKISLHNLKIHNEIDERVTNLIIKHASCLRSLCISTIYEVDTGSIVCALIDNQIYLRELTIIMGGIPSQVMSSLISYLSTLGGLMEVLTVNSVQVSFNADNLVASVSTSCPKLNRLVTYGCEPCNIETLRRLYEQCPHLRDVSIGDVDKFIEAGEKRESVSIEVQGHNEDWAICLSHVLRRRHYKTVILLLREDYNYRVGNLKSILVPYELHIQSFTHESSLISLLQDLPYLNSLHLFSTVNNQYSDATLAAISEHANSLTELDLSNINFSDNLLSELIKKCELLKRLIINGCGLESLLAISKLSNVNMVNLTMLGVVSRDLLDGLLLDDKVAWPSTLKEGSIKANGCRIPYKFNNISHQWN
eukprot:scaffold12987_cov199-Ochromonas_danica.AAC.1